MENPSALRVSSLFGEELGERLVKLGLVFEPPSGVGQRNNKQGRGSSRPRGGDGSVGDAADMQGRASQVNEKQPSPVERSSSLPKNYGDAGGGVGIFDKIRRANSLHYQNEGNSRPSTAQGARPHWGGFESSRPQRESRPTTANGDSQRSERQPAPARPSSPGGGGSAGAARRAEMAARAQAALKRQQRREYEADAGGGNSPSAPAAEAGLPGATGRELYTINIEYKGARKLLSSVILTRAEFNTFTFLDLRQRAAQEQHWGAGDITAFIQDSTERPREVRDFEVLISQIQHNATVTFEPVNKKPQQRPISGKPAPGVRGCVPPGVAPEFPKGPSPPHARHVPPSHRPQSGAQPAGQRQPAGAYAARAANQGGHSYSNPRRPSGNVANPKAAGARKDMERAALWHGWLTAELPTALGNFSDRQLQVFLVQAGVQRSEVQQLGRPQLVDSAERLVPQWEVARILACSSAQQVLRTMPTATGAELKAAYRRLMVKVHPDKNGADEASQAMSILTDSYQQLISKT